MKHLLYALQFACATALISCQDDDKTSDDILTTNSDETFNRPGPPPASAPTADQIAPQDLIAYWPLNGNGIESKSGTPPSNTVNTTWVTGQKGQAALFTAGFMDYPSIAELNNPGESITISCWAKITNTRIAANEQSYISPLLTFSSGPEGNNVYGNLSLWGNTHGLVSSDSIQIKAGFGLKAPGNTLFMGDCVNMIRMEPWMVDDNASGITPPHEAHPNKIGGQWAQIVYVYDGATANNRLYVNGVKISNPPWESRNGGNAMPMNFFQPSHPIIGATQTVADGTNIDAWNAALSGTVDEIRVWKKALRLAEIRMLYGCEKAGR